MTSEVLSIWLGFVGITTLFFNLGEALGLLVFCSYSGDNLYFLGLFMPLWFARGKVWNWLLLLTSGKSRMSPTSAVSQMALGLFALIMIPPSSSQGRQPVGFLHCVSRRWRVSVEPRLLPVSATMPFSSGC